jgi:hypothetical protein
MKTLRSIASVLISAAFAAACLDLSPLPYSAPEAGVVDGSVADVALDAIGADAFGGACIDCLRTSCKSTDMACEQSPKCAQFAACVNATQCWGASLADLTNLPTCLLQCGSSAGIGSQADPASALVGPLLICAQDPKVCATSCLGAADK